MRAWVTPAVAALLALGACSEHSVDTPAATGGATSTSSGGTASTISGGANASGQSSSGGSSSVSSGGTVSSGGSAAMSGGANSGGQVSSGGSSANRGGSPSSGGRAGSTGGAAGRDAGGAAGSAGGGAAGEPGNLTAFYLDVSGRVMAIDVATRVVRTVVAAAGQGPDGIALDLPRGHIYWTGMGVPADDDGFVKRSDLDGKNVVTIVPAGGAYTPKQLKLDHEHDKLYWSDREGMRVTRANLDGSGIETLVTTGTTAADRKDNSRWCVGIALDVAGGFFYYSQKGPDNGHEGSLRRAHLTLRQGETPATRSDVEVLFAGLPEPVDIDLDLTHGFIYWTDRGDDTVSRAPLAIPSGSTAATRTDREIVVKGVREAIGVTLDLARGKLFFTGGTLGRVGSANLDGGGLVDLVTGSAGLTGIVLAELP